jgi:hypothetical protein
MSFSAGWQLVSQADDQLIRVDAEAEEEIAHAIAHQPSARARPPLEPPLVNESFPNFLDEDLDSGNDSMPQAFEFVGRI